MFVFLLIGGVYFIASLLYRKSAECLKYMSFGLISMSLSGLTYMYQVFISKEGGPINIVALATIGLLLLSALCYKSYEIRTSKGP